MMFCTNTSLNIIMSAEHTCHLARIHLNIGQYTKKEKLSASRYLAVCITSIAEQPKSSESVIIPICQGTSAPMAKNQYQAQIRLKLAVKTSPYKIVKELIILNQFRKSLNSESILVFA